MNEQWIKEGGIGGIVAGMVMAMVAMMYTLIAQADLFAPIKQIGALFFPSDSASAASVLVGTALHMMTAAGFGVAFALLVRGRIAGITPLAAVATVFALLEWLVASYLILPTIDTALLTTFASAGGFVAHAMYGVVLGLWLGVRTRWYTRSFSQGRALGRKGIPG